MPYQDNITRYLFETQSVRGELVRVSETWRKMVENHHYPEPVQRLLGELLVVTSLLTAMLKFNGKITAQIQGEEGPLSLAMVSGTHQQEMRGVARLRGEITPESTLKDMTGEQAYLVITIAQENAEPYQGIILLEKEKLTECIEDYFLQSEQLLTRLLVFTDMRNGNFQAGGLLLQALPNENEDLEGFLHLSVLTQTLTSEELFTLPDKEIFRRLYHEETLICYDPQPVCFKCTCSRERCKEVLASLPYTELLKLLDEAGKIDMQCDCCEKHYFFDSADIAGMYYNPGNTSKNLH